MKMINAVHLFTETGNITIDKENLISFIIVLDSEYPEINYKKEHKKGNKVTITKI
jgi:hypothetical protein